MPIGLTPNLLRQFLFITRKLLKNANSSTPPALVLATLPMSIHRSGGLHRRILWPTTTLGYHPSDILARIFDITGLAVNTVLRVDLKGLL